MHISCSMMYVLGVTGSRVRGRGVIGRGLTEAKLNIKAQPGSYAFFLAPARIKMTELYISWRYHQGGNWYFKTHL